MPPENDGQSQNQNVLLRMDYMQQALNRIENDMKQGLVSKDVFNGAVAILNGVISSLTDRVKKQEDTTTWVVRSIGLMVIAAIVGSVLITR